MTTLNEGVPLITPIPDDNTSEAILYGSKYRFAKSSHFMWDAVENEMRAEIERLKRTLIDREFCAHVMTTCPNMIMSRRPPVSHPDKIRDLWTLRRIVNIGSGLERLDVIRRQNEMWAVMQGAREYTKGLMDRGEITESRWRSATCGYDLDLSYEAVRASIDRDDLQAAKETETILDDWETYRRKCEAFDRDFENTRRAMDLPDEDDDEDDDIPDIRILKEVEEEPTELDDIFDDTTPEDEEPEQGQVTEPMVFIPRLFDVALAHTIDWLSFKDPIQELSEEVRA